jgi:hypothetical protein
MPTKFTSTFMLFFAFVYLSNASMICPPTKHIGCDDDIDNLNLTGKPTLFGIHKYFTPLYTDQSFANSCNVGHTIRRWFIDLNNNGICEYEEPACYQDIFQKDQTYSNVSITYPKDITVNCLGDISDTSPQITNGPCDLIGVSYTDQEFILIGSGDEGCKKILRKFTIINWCDYNPNHPSSSTWTGTQVIKIVDKVKPSITACKDVTIGFNQGCKAQITLSNKAIDEGSCASIKLYWVAEVDLYSDGINDFVYSNSQSGEFFLAQKNNNEEIKITLPGTYGNGLHKVVWKVKDSCGNLTSCSSTIVTKDTTAPTPYCPGQVSVGVSNDGGDVRVGAGMFNFGSFDNCTAPQFIKTSFSQNIADSTRIFDCNNAGFQELNVYFHDIAGNFNFCKVALTVYDNNGCLGNLSLKGKVMSYQGKPVTNGKVHLQANQELLNMYRDVNDGEYIFESTSIYSDSKITPSKIGIDEGQIDLEDYLIFREYLMSLDTLTTFGLLAGDINEDGRANGRDMVLMIDFIKENKTSFGNNDWKFVPNYTDLKKLTLKNYSPTYDTRKFKGALDFIAIAKADFSESLEITSGKRTSEAVNLVEGDIAIINGENYVPLYMDKAVSAKALELKTSLAKEDVIVSKELESVNRTHGQVLYAFNDLELSKDFPLLYVKANVYSRDLTFSGYLIEANNNERIAIKKIEKELKQIEVFPNPAQSFIVVDAPINTNVKIYNTSGQMQLQETILEYKAKIDVSQLKSGVYFIQIGKNTGKLIKI